MSSGGFRRYWAYVSGLFADVIKWMHEQFREVGYSESQDISFLPFELIGVALIYKMLFVVQKTILFRAHYDSISKSPAARAKGR